MGWKTFETEEETGLNIYERLTMESIEWPGRLEHFHACASALAVKAGKKQGDKGFGEKYLRQNFYRQTLKKCWKVFRPIDEVKGVDETDLAAPEVYDAEAEADRPEKTCSKQEAIEWTLRHFDKKSIPKDIAPSDEAWNLHAWATTSEANKSEFMRYYYVKLVPNQNEVDEAERRKESSDPLTDDLQDRIDVLMLEDDMPEDQQEEG